MIRRNKEWDHGSAVCSTMHAMVRVTGVKQFHRDHLDFLFVLRTLLSFKIHFALTNNQVKR